MFLLEHSELIETRMKLIPEKIAIPSYRPRIARPRLLTLLERSMARCSATVVSGRAGTGKTALATDFARSCGRSVAWYKVDASDLDLRVFVRYLVSSIADQRRGFGERALLSLLGSLEPDPMMLAEAIAYELMEDEKGSLVIVIDDIHLVCEGAWLVPFLCRLLPLLPRNVHLLITSRTMPPAPLWRMRSKQTLEVIDEGPLAFTRAEAVELFETYGLAPELAYVARDHSHGRAAALASAALTLSNPRITQMNQVAGLALDVG
jgi:LuxR family maltose regulon positive regulatory protein